MVAIPVEAVTQEELNAWYVMQTELSALKVKEMALRNKIFKFHFQNPIEGTNTVPLTDGWVIKAKYPITRNIRIDVFTAMEPVLKNAGVDLASLIKYKPEVVLAEYRKLPKEHAILFDQALEIKAGSPALEIMQPKRATA